MVGATSAIAIAAGMHVIPTARFTPQTRADRLTLLQHSSNSSPPPTSQIDLADRIFALYALSSPYHTNSSWAIFLCDRCSAISQTFPEIFNVDRVSTPLPRKWSEYENASAADTLR